MTEHFWFFGIYFGPFQSFVLLPAPIYSLTVPIMVQRGGRFNYVLDNGSPAFLVSLGL